jgi:Ca-activated chloride channel family protein
MKLRCVLLLLAMVTPVLVNAADGEDRPLALNVEVQQLGRGVEHTVVGIVVRVAPEDQPRVGERARILVTLLDGTEIADRHAAVVEIAADGSATLYREWPPGRYELQIGLAASEGASSGVWFGNVEVAEMAEPFVAPPDAPPDAVALELTQPRQGVVRFLPPPDVGGIGAIQLEVEAPQATSSVEFFQDDRSLGRRNRPPWTVSVPLGQIVRRTMVRAIASDGQGRFLGEDAVVLNNPTGQIGVEILLAPEGSVRDGKRTVTVAVTGGKQIQQVTLTADDRQLARWAECPCVAEVDDALLERTNILAADAVDASGNRGDTVIALAAGGGFVGSVQVELVELPVVVLDDGGLPVIGLAQTDFTVYEDGQKVEVEGFGTTADLPLSLVIAVDTSGSMVEEFDDVKQALRGFADALLEEDDTVALIRFAWDATVEVAWTEDVRQIKGRFDRFQPDGGTSLHDAVVRSLEQFRGRRGRQAVVLLTDGEDTTSRTGWSVAERFAHTMRVPIFPIGLGLGSLDFNSRGVLKSLSAETGGEAFFPKKVDELPAVYARIAELLRSQYLLWYSSPSTKPIEEFREIRVEAARPGLKVQTIRGYYPGK